MSVTLLEVMAAAQARRAPLVAELAGYLVLGAADQSAGAPRRIRAADVVLAEDGAVRVVGAGNACASDAAEESLRSLLGELMQVASSATPALFRTTQRSAGAGVDALIGELETALIPVNRAAARRALSRLHRETARALESGYVDAPAFEAQRSEAPSAALAAQEAVPPEHVDPGCQESLPGFEPVAAPEPVEPEPEPEEWSVPLEMLQASPEAPDVQLPLGVPEPVAESRDDETAPETIVARTRGVAERSDEVIELPSCDLEVVLELSPPVAEVALEPSPPEVVLELSPPAAEVAPEPSPPAVPPVEQTPMLGTLCAPEMVRDPVDSEDPDVTDRAPPVFEPEETRPLELDAELTRVAPPVGPSPSAADEDYEEIEWIEVEPSVEPPLCRDPEPFGIAPSADPPGVEARWRPSVVVVGGAPTVDTHPGPPPCEPEPTPAPCEPEPTPPPRVPGEKPAPAPARFAPRQSDVSELLDSFSVAGTRSESELRGDLKRIAGLEPTPPPAGTSSVE
jgi:hypothetical protein